MGTAAATDLFSFDALAGLLAGGGDVDAVTVAGVLERERRSWTDLVARCDALAAAVADPGPDDRPGRV